MHVSRPLYPKRRRDVCRMGGDSSDDYGATINMVSVEFDTWFGLTIFIGSLMHHKNLFFRTYSRQNAVISNPNQQSATISIDKSRNRFGKFTGIRDPVFEILLLVLALAD